MRELRLETLDGDFLDLEAVEAGGMLSVWSKNGCENGVCAIGWLLLAISGSVLPPTSGALVGVGFVGDV